jgi:DNA-binding Lrp family transcriptional regulator
LAYADRLPLQTIARQVGVSRPTVYKCIDKALTMGWEAGLKHLYHLGTASILAALDLSTGHVIARVEERHRSQEFIALLKDLDSCYPSHARIRIILDNHSAYVSQETRVYLATRSNRFEYVHTPKHGSWLNPVETLFSKMNRTFLRHIRVASWAELKERIEKGIAEINANPVVHRWKNFDLEPEQV